MKRLVEPHVTINFAPSERQMELWEVLQPAKCDKCGGKIEMRQHGVDERGIPVHEATCVKCGNTDIPEQILGGGAAGKNCSTASLYGNVLKNSPLIAGNP